MAKKKVAAQTAMPAQANKFPAYWNWFNQSRYGMFIHWGPYAIYSRGEQVINRERIDHDEYAAVACAWNPKHYDAKLWAFHAKQAGMKYAVFGSRHHDGYCMWDTKTTDYSSMKQAAGRDFLREYVDAFRAAGLRVGVYYSLLEFRLPGWYLGPEKDPKGWAAAKKYVYEQIREVLTNYGKIDVIWFDGLWPRNSKDIESRKLIEMIRELQPEILINDRLEWPQHSWFWQGEQPAGVEHEEFGDFGTPEHGIYSKAGKLWESCQTSTWRLWGHAAGERWKTTEQILDLLVECASMAGNLLLNVGPDAEGQFPPEFTQRIQAIGHWLSVHGEAIYGSEGGNVTEFVTHGWQTVKGNNLYLILRFHDGKQTLRVNDLKSRVKRATLITTGQELSFTQKGEDVILAGLPPTMPTALFPVIRLECDGKPEGGHWARHRIWGGDVSGYVEWAKKRGTSVWRDGKER